MAVFWGVKMAVASPHRAFFALVLQRPLCLSCPFLAGSLHPSVFSSSRSPGWLLSFQSSHKTGRRKTAQRRLQLLLLKAAAWKGSRQASTYISLAKIYCIDHT